MIDFNVFLKAKKIVQNYAPINKRKRKGRGNLRYNATRDFSRGKTKYVIYIDDKKIAPYMPYTNEKWVSPRWNGKKNPNEKWFDNAYGAVVEYCKQELHGTVKKNIKYKKYNKAGELVAANRVSIKEI